MRNLLLTLVFMATVAGTAQARLGENADQLVQRYGQPLSEKDQKSEDGKIALADVVFQKGGFEIDVTIVGGISMSETFKKLNGDSFAVDEVRLLLTDNSDGHQWEAPQTIEGQKLWIRDDNATALLEKDGSLTLKSRELVAKEADARKLANSPSLDGF